MPNASEIYEQELFQLRDGRYVASAELSQKLFIIKKTQPESFQIDNDGYSWDELGMSELFAQCYVNDTRYCPETKSWYTYDEGVWKKDTEALLVSKKIGEFVRLMTMYCGEILDEEKRKDYFKFVSKMGDRRFRDRLMKDARSRLGIAAAEFDNNPYLINCINGTYDLRTRSFREHDWRDFLTMRTNFEYTVQDDVRCERWEQFIREVTNNEKDKADFLQRALGYSILGHSREECMFILHGSTTRNGKSTMLGTIHHLLGDYASVSPVSIICRADRSKNAEAASPVMASLKGKRFVTMAESSQYGRLDEDTIKQLTGGEEITARNLYEKPITFLPQFTLWLSCNDLPTVQDKSVFSSNRIKVVEFNRHFKADEIDESLKDLFREPDAMTGIFTWLLEGYENYLKNRLKMSENLLSVIRKYEKDNDLVLQFLEEKCEKSENGQIKGKLLYDLYKIWCKQNGYFVCSSKKFGASLMRLPDWCREKKTIMGYVTYYGFSAIEG